MHRLFAAIRIGLIDMRGDLRRFGLLITCLAVGTALIAGVSSVGTGIRQAVDHDAAQLMGGDVELSRADRPATAAELATIDSFGRVASVVDTNVRAENGANQGFVDLIAVGPNYPLLGQVSADTLPASEKPHDFLSNTDGTFGALVDALLLDQLGAKSGDTIMIGGTPFEVRGVLYGVPDAAVRGFRLGLPTLISQEGLAYVGDRTSPLPGLGSWFRYKLMLNEGNAEDGKAALEAALNDSAWTIRSAREGLGEMVRYYDMFMNFLVIVGLASLLVGGASVWTVISSYVAEKANVIAVLRSMGSERSRIFIHFFTQVALLALVGVGIGLIIGASLALLAMPAVGAAVGVSLAPTIYVGPLAIAAAVGLLTAFAFSYLPLLQAQSISPVTLFRAKGLAAPPIDWRHVIFSGEIIPVVIATALIGWLAVILTGNALLVAAFAVACTLAVLMFRVALSLLASLMRRMPAPSNRTMRHALRAIENSGTQGQSVVVSVGLALAMLVMILTLQLNLRNEYLGASVFDAPTLVASDLFPDEAAELEKMREEGGDITRFTATPMLRGALVAINGTPTQSFKPRGPEAAFLLSGDVPITYRAEMPSSSRLVEGKWWAPDYSGEPLLSLHQSLKNGLGVKIGDTLTFSLFGDNITAKIASFRDYSWQGGIDFLSTFSPGVLESYPATLLGAVTAAKGREEAVERELATRLPDVRFIPIGATLDQITESLGQLSLAATLVGGLAVGNGLLVLIGSLAAGRKQRQADAVITKVLGGTRRTILQTAMVQFGLLSMFAALLATPVGLLLGFLLNEVLLDVAFSFATRSLVITIAGAVVLTAILGATTILSALRPKPALRLREMGAD